MPIYEYECIACGHKLEAIQKVSDVPLVDCPECEESKLRKLVSAAGFRLRGSGWYETDFKSGNRNNASGGEENTSDTGKSPASNTDSTCGSDDCCPATRP